VAHLAVLHLAVLRPGLPVDVEATPSSRVPALTLQVAVVGSDPVETALDGVDITDIRPRPRSRQLLPDRLDGLADDARGWRPSDDQGVGVGGRAC